jgi:hypothetical protein
MRSLEKGIARPAEALSLLACLVVVAFFAVLAGYDEGQFKVLPALVAAGIGILLTAFWLGVIRIGRTLLARRDSGRK